MQQQFLINLKQRRNETVAEYLVELKRLARLGYPDWNVQQREIFLKPIFSQGLLSEIHDQLRYREFNDLDTLQRAATYVESKKQFDLFFSSAINLNLSPSFSVFTPTVTNSNQANIVNSTECKPSTELLSINKALSLIVDKLSEINPAQSHKPQRTQPYSNPTNRKSCRICSKIGHTEDIC